MRFFIGLLVGSAVGSAVAVGALELAPGDPAAEAREMRHEVRKRSAAELEARNLKLEVERLREQLKLDAARRAGGPVDNPKGEVVPADGRIPPQRVPVLPVPVPAPKDTDEVDEPNEMDEPEPNDGGEEQMAAATKQPTGALAPVRSLGASIALNSVDDLIRLADILYRGGACNIPGIGSPAAAAHVMLAGLEVGFTPTQSFNTIMLLDGKTSIYGDGALALAYASGVLDHIKEWSEGEGDALTYCCEVKRKGEAEAIVRRYSVEDAKTADCWQGGSGPKKKQNWVKHWKRMMQMRARGFALRDKFPDVLKGLHIWEELADGDSDRTVINAEVRVVGHTTDAPAAPAQSATPVEPAPAVEPPKSLPASGSAGSTEPVTDEQKEEFLVIRKSIMAGRNITDREAQKAAWEQVLAPYGVSSVGQMNRELAARAIAELGAKHDPFGHPATDSLQT
jgi:hypothetical protein